MPAVKTHALSAAQIKNLKEPGTYTDGEGLTLRVASNWRKTLGASGDYLGQAAKYRTGRLSLGVAGPGPSGRPGQHADDSRRHGPGSGARGSEGRGKGKGRHPDIPGSQPRQVIEPCAAPTWSSERHAKTVDGIPNPPRFPGRIGEQAD